MPLLWVLIVGLSLLLAACSSAPAAPTAAKVVAPTAAPAAPTAVPQAAAPTAAPTAVPKPAATAVPATTYPDKPVTIIVPYPAGGPIDLIARTMSQAVKPFFSQPISVVNRPGADGVIGNSEVVRAKADGYTIGITNQESLVLQVHRAEAPYKTPDDYAPVIDLVTTPSNVFSQTEAKWNDLKGLFEYAKANPGKVRYGLSGSVAARLALQKFREQAQVEITEVPFDGAAPSVTALLGGHVEAINTVTSASIAHVQAGKLKVLATLGDKRNPKWPDRPSAREQGYDVVQANYYLAFAPKGTPDAVVQAIHDAFKKGMEADVFKKFMDDNSFISDYYGPADLKKKLQADYVFYGEAIKKIQ